MLKLNYDQFTGTIQVMKAVGGHMVLTFCENLPGSQLFSVILSRTGQSLTLDVSNTYKFSLHSFSFISSSTSFCHLPYVFNPPPRFLHRINKIHYVLIFSPGFGKHSIDA